MYSGPSSFFFLHATAIFVNIYVSLTIWFILVNDATEKGNFIQGKKNNGLQYSQLSN